VQNYRKLQSFADRKESEQKHPCGAVTMPLCLAQMEPGLRCVPPRVPAQRQGSDPRRRHAGTERGTGRALAPLLPTPETSG